MNDILRNNNKAYKEKSTIRKLKKLYSFSR